MIRFAWFITPHGFGHATRSLAVMNALQRKRDDVFFHIFSRLPHVLIQETIGDGYQLHEVTGDLGLVQKRALEVDHPATLARLDAMLPFDQSETQRLAEEIRACNAAALICDIAPWGVLVAKEAGIPSVMVENFRWDWIYGDFSAEYPAYEPHIEKLKAIFDAADHTFQTEPVCGPRRAVPSVPCVFRALREDRHSFRAKLDLGGRKLILVTVGGMQENDMSMDRIAAMDDYFFILPAGSQEPGDNCLAVKHGELYHPDLLNAADGVIGKLGYSTVAEIYQAGTPFAYVGRHDFRESIGLAAFMRQHNHGFQLSEDDFVNGNWLDRLDELTSAPRAPHPSINGADVLAGHLLQLVRAS